MRKLLIALAFSLPLTANALTPQDLLNDVPGIAPESPFPCLVEGEPKFCLPFSVEGTPFRAVVPVLSTDVDIETIYTPPSGKYPEGQIAPEDFLESVISSI